MPLRNAQIRSHVPQRHMLDDGGFLPQKFPIPLFGRQTGHVVDPGFFFFEVFLQNLNRVIFLRTAALRPNVHVFPTDAEQFAIGNAVQVFVGNRAVHKMEIRRKKPGTIVEVGRDFVVIRVYVKVSHIPRNDKIMVLGNLPGRFDNRVFRHKNRLERLANGRLVFVGQTQNFPDITEKPLVVMFHRESE